MKTFVWNLVLALAWCTITTRLTALNLLLGFAIGYVALRPPAAKGERPKYFVKARLALEFALFFTKEVTLSTFRVAYDVLTPTSKMRPAVLAVPLEAKTDTEITMLANLLTLTPGSLALELSADRSTLYVHQMFVSDAEASVRRLKSGFERRVLELLR